MVLKGCLALSPGSLFVSFALCYSGLLGLSLSFSLLHSSKDPSPSYGNELCAMDMRVKMRFAANFQPCLQESLLALCQNFASPL